MTNTKEVVVLVQKEEGYVDGDSRVLKWVYKGWVFFESLLCVSIFSCTKEGILGFNLMLLSFFVCDSDVFSI